MVLEVSPQPVVEVSPQPRQRRQQKEPGCGDLPAAGLGAPGGMRRGGQGRAGTAATPARSRLRLADCQHLRGEWGWESGKRAVASIRLSTQQRACAEEKGCSSWTIARSVPRVGGVSLHTLVQPAPGAASLLAPGEGTGGRALLLPRPSGCGEGKAVAPLPLQLNQRLVFCSDKGCC